MKKPYDPSGFDGAEIFLLSRKLPGASRQFQTQAIRGQPGTFEWRYARYYPSQDVRSILYEAGTDLSRLWERAGALPSGVDLNSAGASQWRGLPNGAAMAMLEVRELTKAIGMLVSSRLVNYCVVGHTSRQMANSYDVPQRTMSTQLEADLKVAAVHFGYLRS